MTVNLGQVIRDYLLEAEDEYKTGIAAEHAYRPALERLLEAAGTGLNAVNDPRRTDIGAPDFVVLRGNLPIGIVDHLLKTKFNRPEGLADGSTLILDPATGTGTFLYFVIQQIYESLGRNVGMWDQDVQNTLLKRILGFELLMAPYTIAHMKLGLELARIGYDLNRNERLKIYLTNALEQVVKEDQAELVAHYLVEEAREAAEIKREKPIMVVLGNPPYSGHSANASTKLVNVGEGEQYISGWTARADGRAAPVMRTASRALTDVEQPNCIGRILRDYYFVDGKPLGERNPKYLQDDYVKFIRFAQWRIEQTGEGILAYVSNNGYLDNPTFRGMRQQLMAAFDEICILDLHGSSRKKETAPDGGPDENVLDIQQGVAIGIFVKRKPHSLTPSPFSAFACARASY